MPLSSEHISPQVRVFPVSPPHFPILPSLISKQKIFLPKEEQRTFLPSFPLRPTIAMIRYVASAGETRRYTNEKISLIHLRAIIPDS